MNDRWDLFYAAAITGLLAQRNGYGPENVSEQAARIADEALKIADERSERRAGSYRDAPK